MKSAINTLEKKVLSLKIERRVWSKPPNFSQNIVDKIGAEIKECQRALAILKNQKLMSKLLNVREISVQELIDNWDLEASLKKWNGKQLFIRCNAKGIINWGKAPVYIADELIELDNVKIIKVND